MPGNQDLSKSEELDAELEVGPSSLGTAPVDSHRNRMGEVPTILEVENGPFGDESLIFQGPIFHFHDYGKKTYL